MIQQPLEIPVEKSSYWYKHFQKFQQSGLSKTAYSNQYQLVKPQFMYWSKKFEVALAKENKKSNSDFVAVQIKQEEIEPIDVLCTLEFGSHRRLLIHSVSALKSILTLLESGSCS
jgi:hypothetical protein